MKLAFVKQKYVPFGGGEGYVARLMAGCAERGHDIHLITSDWTKGEVTHPLQVHGVSINRRSRATKLTSFSASVKQCIDVNDFDCVFSLERTVGQDVWRAGEGVHRKWMERRALYEPVWKTFLNEHSSGQKAYLDMEAETVRSSRFIISNSHLVKQDILDVYPDLGADVFVIHNGVDLNRFSPSGRDIARKKLCDRLNLATDTPMLLFVGSNWRRKGLYEVLQAVASIPVAHLLVTGRDKVEKWKSLVIRLGLADRVHFLSPTRVIEEYYRAVDVLAFPSWYDPFPNVGIEALACGTSIVTSRFTGVCEVVDDERMNGVVVSLPSAVQELAAGINKLLEIRGLSGRADDVRASVEDCSLGRNFDETLAVIERVASKGAAS